MISRNNILTALVVTLLGFITFMQLSKKEEPKVIRFEYLEYPYDSIKIKTKELILYDNGIPKHIQFREQLILIK